MDDMQFNPDGTVDLKWFNSLPKDAQIMYSGKWTAEQLADYKTKKTQLAQDEILDLELEESIEDSIETARIVKEKFGTKDFFLGKNEDDEFILVGPFYDDSYKDIRHEYIIIEKKSMYCEFNYLFFYDEYQYRKIKEEEYQEIFKIFHNANSQIYDLLMKDSKILDRKVREGDCIWCYGGVMKIKAISYETGKYWSTGYHYEGGLFQIYEPLDSIPYETGNFSIFNQNEEWPHRFITEEAFFKGYEIEKNALAELRRRLINLYESETKVQ